MTRDQQFGYINMTQRYIYQNFISVNIFVMSRLIYNFNAFNYFKYLHQFSKSKLYLKSTTI